MICKQADLMYQIWNIHNWNESELLRSIRLENMIFN